MWERLYRLQKELICGLFVAIQRNEYPWDVTVFLKAAIQESVPRKIIYLIVIHAKMLGQSHLSSTTLLITACGCACSFSGSPLFARD